MSLGFVGGPLDHAELRRPAAAVMMLCVVAIPEHEPSD